MSLMKYAVIGVLLVIVNAEEAKSIQNKAPLTSSNEWRQQSKRQSTYGSSNTLNSGFQPITSSYPSVNNYVGNAQPYTSAASNVQTKQSFNPYLTSSTTYGYKTPTFSSYPTYQQFHPLTFAASQAPPVTYMQQPNHYGYASASNIPQYYAQQVPFNQFAFNTAQPINPVVHTAPIASFANSYQMPANSLYYSPQQVHKVPFYNQQPQTFNVASYHPVNYHHHVKETLPTSPPSQIIASKPVAVEAPIGSTAASHVEHNNHGAVSYSHYSQFGEAKPSAAPLIATPTPQQVYYNQQPQAIYNGNYGKHHYASHPIASNYYQPQGALSYSNVPYAHISKIQYGAQAAAAAASTLIPSVSSYPHKIAFH